jgi:hypothetical protein
MITAACILGGMAVTMLYCIAIELGKVRIALEEANRARTERDGKPLRVIADSTTWDAQATYDHQVLMDDLAAAIAPGAPA